MQKIPLVLLMLSAANTVSAADAIDVQFKGTLTNPTCTASFTGTTGTDLHFPTLKASDFSSLHDGDVVSSTAVPGYLKFTACGAGVAGVTIQFVGSAVAESGFQGKASYFIASGLTVSSRLGLALFKTSTDTSAANAIDLKGPAERFALTSLVKEGNDYKYNVFGRIVVASADYALFNSLGNLTASGVINIGYE